MKRIGGGKLQGNQQILDSWAAGNVINPLVVEVTVTGGCNHGCTHCGSQQFKPYPDAKNFIDREAFMRFLSDFTDMGGIEVFYAGWGEPLLHPRIDAFLEEGSQLGLVNVMSSNGSALTEANARKILPQLAWIRFSVNGGDADSYARVHQCPADEFQKLRRNLEKASAVRDRMGLDTRLIVQFITLDSNFRSIEKAVEIHRAAGIDQIVFRNAGNRDHSLPQAWPEIQEILQGVENGRDVTVRWETFSTPEDWPPWSHCHGINFRINLDSQGNLLTCSKHLLTDTTYGNILEQGFAEIWNSQRRKDVFTRVEPGEDISECSLFCQVASDNIFIDHYLTKR